MNTIKAGIALVLLSAGAVGAKAVINGYHELQSLQANYTITQALLMKCNQRVLAMKEDQDRDELVKSTADHDLRNLLRSEWMLPE